MFKFAWKLSILLIFSADIPTSIIYEYVKNFQEIVLLRKKNISLINEIRIWRNLIIFKEKISIKVASRFV